MIEAKFFTVGTYLYKYNLTVLFVSPSKIAHDTFYSYCPPLLLNEIYAHDSGLYNLNGITEHVKFLWYNSKTFWILRTQIDCKYQGPDAKKKSWLCSKKPVVFFEALGWEKDLEVVISVQLTVWFIRFVWSIVIFEEKSALCPSLSYLEAVGLVWLERFLQCMKCIPQSYWQTLRRAFKVQ